MGYQWLVDLTQKDVYFVTRMKTNSPFEMGQRRPVFLQTNVSGNEIIFSDSHTVLDRHHVPRIVEV